MDTLALSVLVYREELGLTPLEIGDAPGYYMSPQFMGGTVSWARQTAGSVYIDGEVTTSRRRQMVTEPMAVEVFGRTTANAPMTVAKLHDNHDQLVDAISQDNWKLQITVENEVWLYQCEASDYSMTWSGPRFMARQGQMTVQVLRQPTPLLGSS